MVVENNRVPTSEPSKRPRRQKEDLIQMDFRSTQLTPTTMLMPTAARPLTQSAHSVQFPERRSLKV